MKFGTTPVGEAEGAILAHSVRLHDRLLRKGTRLGADHIAALAAEGVAAVVVARLEAGDVHEDEAAETVARAVAGAGVRVERPFTGRSNLFAESAGLVMVDRAAIDRTNLIDPAVTVATVPEFKAIVAGEMVATVKIIPFAVRQATLAAIPLTPAIRVAPFRALRIGLVATTLPSLKPSVMDKTRRLLDRRLARAGASVVREDRVPHNAAAVAAALQAQRKAGAELLIVFGASAVVDIADVIPAAIVEAGGRIERLGMPVDPGNLLVLGEIGGTSVIGAPGCARSPRENGFDWILDRVLAGIAVTSGDIAALGVGGLLTEIASRPQPRDVHAPKIAALVLAAGSSRRMGGVNKLAATVRGKPLVRIAAEAAIKSVAEPVIVVTGHDPRTVESALAGLAVSTVGNLDHAQGLSTSLRAGLRAVPDDVDGVVVLLGDMPGIDAPIVDRLISAFRPGSIVVPMSQGQRGNPVVWPRRFFAALMEVVGDKGGRDIIEANRDAVIAVAIGPDAALDVDTPEALAAAGGLASP